MLWLAGHDHSLSSLDSPKKKLNLGNFVLDRIMKNSYLQAYLHLKNIFTREIYGSEGHVFE